MPPLVDDDPRTVPIVFLHGLGATCHMWDEHARCLAEFRCVAPDLPAHGTASARPWVSLAATAAEVAALIERLPERRAHIVGLSLGGAVALELLATTPDLLGDVVVDGVSAVPWRWSRPFLWGVAAISPFIHTRPVMRAVAATLGIARSRRPAFYAEFGTVPPASFRAAVRDALGARLPAGARPRNRVLLVAGERDVAAARRSNVELAALLANGSAWYIRGGRHAWVANAPDLHKEMIRAFLTRRPLPPPIVPEPASGAPRR